MKHSKYIRFFIFIIVLISCGLLVMVSCNKNETEELTTTSTVLPSKHVNTDVPSIGIIHNLALKRFHEKGLSRADFASPKEFLEAFCEIVFDIYGEYGIDARSIDVDFEEIKNIFAQYDEFLNENPSEAVLFAINLLDISQEDKDALYEAILEDSRNDAYTSFLVLKGIFASGNYTGATLDALESSVDICKNSIIFWSEFDGNSNNSPLCYEDKPDTNRNGRGRLSKDEKGEKICGYICDALGGALGSIIGAAGGPWGSILLSTAMGVAFSEDVDNYNRNGPGEPGDTD